MITTGAWGPVATGGPGRRWPRRVAAVLLAGLVTSATALASVGTQAVQAAQDNIEVVALTGLDATEEGKPLHVLLVGSDARDDLTREQIDELTLGNYTGQRSDTVILVSVSADRSTVSLVSMPRDLVVSDSDGGIAKLTETFGDGRDELVRAVREDLGFPVNNYVEVSIGGFIGTVEAVGGVRMCLDEPLYDRKSGADFEAGCQEFTPAEALAYVRSREGGLGDVERIDRQQQFLRAMLARIIDLRLLFTPGRLVDVAEEVSSQVTTDDQLSITRMVGLAQDLQGAVREGIEMVTVPGYSRSLDDGGVSKSFIVPYAPGLEALQEAVRSGESLASRGTAELRAETSVGLWTSGLPGAAVVESTLLWGGFQPEVLGHGGLDAGGTTAVIALPGKDEQAGWVAAHLGAPIVVPPAGTDLPDGVDVLVVTGEDAGSRSDPA